MKPAEEHLINPHQPRAIAPEVCVTAKGCVMVFIGGSFRLLPIDVARSFHDALGHAIAQAENVKARA